MPASMRLYTVNHNENENEKQITQIQQKLPTIMVIIFRDFLIYQIFLSPQVKGNAIISNKNGICKLHQAVPKNLRLSYKINANHAHITQTQKPKHQCITQCETGPTTRTNKSRQDIAPPTKIAYIHTTRKKKNRKHQESVSI